MTDRKRYATLVKAILFGLQGFFAVGLAVFVILLQSCINQNMLNLGDLSNSSFVDSGYFEKTFNRQASNVLEYLQLRMRFETNGEYDPQRAEKAGASEEEINLYKKYFNQYETGSSNLYYWLGTESGECMYTNLDAREGEEAALEDVRELGKYLYYDSTTFYFESNVGGMEKSYYRNMREYNSLQKENIQLIIGVDTNFSYSDDFSVAKMEFDKLYPWAKLSVMYIIIFGAGWLFCLCYLSVAAGRRREDRQIHLYRFDRIKTEVVCAIMVIGMSFIMQLAMRVHGQDYSTSGRMIVAGTLVFLADVIFMGLYLCLVRKVKSESFWENSVVNWCATGLRAFLKERYMSGKLLGYFILLTAASLTLGYLAFARGFAWAYVLIAVLILCVFVFLAKWIGSRRRILEGIRHITDGELEYKLNLEEFSMNGTEQELAEGINHIAEGLSKAIHESVRDERMKANMITNVSHDLKTPLTAIINYVGLLKREKIENENAVRYIDVLEQKALRLKSLMEDLVEVSKISSGNITLHMDEIDFVELVRQTGGEYNEKMEQKDLNVISKFPNEPMMIWADGRQLWRVIGNLYNNAGKYAMPNTRVYAEIEKADGWVIFTMKNISEDFVSLPAAELTERFVRGDTARTTEGSGLGLSIAKTLTELMGGRFEISMDADLFCAEVKFRLIR